MASQSRKGARRRSNPKRITYFYLNSDLHKVLRVNRAQDFVEAWNYRERRVMGYIWTDVKKRMERALSLLEVADLFDRHRVQIQNYILDGVIPRPQQTYSLTTGARGKYFFSETDVMRLHDYLLTVHHGRPRKDGWINTGPLPTKAELRAALRHNIINYVKNAEGEFVVAWKEPEW